MSSIDDLADLVMDGLREYSELADREQQKPVGCKWVKMGAKENANP